MTTLTDHTPDREGEIAGKAVRFIIEATFTNGRVTGARGQITEPRVLHDTLAGTTSTLHDKNTGLSWGIFINNDWFSFGQSYDNLERLFA